MIKKSRLNKHAHYDSTKRYKTIIDLHTHIPAYSSNMLMFLSHLPLRVSLCLPGSSEGLVLAKENTPNLRSTALPGGMFHSFRATKSFDRQIALIFRLENCETFSRARATSFWFTKRARIWQFINRPLVYTETRSMDNP